MESVDGNGCGGGSMQLVSELGRVLELVRQLELHLHAPCSSSVDLCRSLAAQIVALTDRSIAIVVSASSPRLPDTPTPQGQLSGTPSPLSGVSDHHQPFGRGGKKRKTSTTMWRSQVRAGGGGAEGPGDDGHSWRKYGQKDILGAKHPRAYYRCTHRNSQGCAATKQVQRADHDPALFDVVYHGDHTCTRAGAAGAKRPHAQTLLQSLGAGLTVDTDVGGLNASATPLTPENYLPAAARGVSPSPAGSEYSAGVAASPYPAPGYGEWPCDGDLQEIVSAFAAAPQPAAMDPEFLPYFFEFDPNMASFFP